jgi:hypothetical protein
METKKRPPIEAPTKIIQDKTGIDILTGLPMKKFIPIINLQNEDNQLITK